MTAVRARTQCEDGVVHLIPQLITNLLADLLLTKSAVPGTKVTIQSLCYPAVTSGALKDFHDGRPAFTEDHPEAAKWRRQRLAWLGEATAVNDNVAIANIDAYPSRTFTDHHVLAALPSSRAMLDWAQSTLFPQAERDERMVVCMRAAKVWGVKPGNCMARRYSRRKRRAARHMRQRKMCDVIKRMARRYV
ncbi:hypothetical protein XI06_28595 [Bradyrhizobium sp. CCBAU 11434]|nr:hypothetical protein [Bradyrhizobium sp. CCBAU 11434]